MKKRQMSSLIRLFIGCLFLLWSSNLSAQKMEQDVVYLKNGSIIRGQIIEHKKEGQIKIEILGGSVLVYQSSEVVRMEKEIVNRRGRYRPKRPMHKIDKGYYVSIVAGHSLGQGDFGAPEPGLSISGVAGYHFHRLLGVGGGVGLSTLGLYPFVPVYANIRGYLLKTSTSLFYDLNVGYGFALPSVMHMNFLGQEATSQGGLYLRPSIGIRFPSTRRTHVVMDFGYEIQFARYDYVDWNRNPVEEKRAFYRPSVRIGIVF